MITLIDDYVVEVEPLNYVLKIDKHKTNKKGEKQYTTVGYYPTLKGAIIAVLHHMNRSQLSTDDYTLKEAIEIISRNNERLELVLRKVMGELENDKD